MHVEHLGGERCVTGSCHLVRAGDVNILVDCGLTQGNDRARPMAEWPLNPEDIHYVFLTHAHVDHVGRLPDLVLAGFRGEILTTHATKAILGPMLEDALGFTDLSDQNRREVMSRIHKASWGFEYNMDFDLTDGIRFHLGHAGHILGSCWVRLEQETRANGPASVVFSGDLGPPDTPLLPDPDVPDSCDLLVMESTYGDRVHEDRKERIMRLGKVLTRALEDRGKVYIPAFSLGRTQELLYEMDRLFSESGSTVGRIPVFLDSPLGLEITRVYSSLSEYWDREARGLLERGDHPLSFKHLYAVRSYKDHQRVLGLEGPAIVVAGSGMCTGGRIVNHLKHGLGDERNDILFVGYQAQGTPGRDIKRYSRRPDGYVILDGERFPIRARVCTLGGYSAHADQEDLIRWARAVGPKQIKLVHGEANARQALGRLLGTTEAHTGCTRHRGESFTPDGAITTLNNLR